jgi:hypothetical protein
MDPKTDELRAAHDALSGFYRERLADALEHTPEDLRPKDRVRNLLSACASCLDEAN